ncbi:hypothetical protein [Rubripirellula lacrimiformis]|uniref:hypothetical protein n=1 Tax=Rubripirellula lacrimiformis TaxID=1930273 RepID=UPI001C54CA0D|nr:hypothetical protein [Rubripirellula lacrimiformis]
MRYIAIALLVLPFASCRSISQSRLRADNQDEMLTAVRTVVPIGTSIGAARAQMEHSGFDCKVIENGSFSEDPGFIGSDREYRNVDNANFLECRRNESAGLLVSHLWTVAIVYDDDDTVSDVLVLHRMEGP